MKNPVMNRVEKTCSRMQAQPNNTYVTETSIVNATAITLLVITAVAVANFCLFVFGNPMASTALTLVGAIGALIVVIMETFSKTFGSKVRTLIYAVFEGLFVGGVSALFTHTYAMGQNVGIIIAEALICTVAVFFGMLFLYSTGKIRVTARFRSFMSIALLGTLIAVTINLFTGIFLGVAPLTSGGVFTILFSIVCIVLASLSLVEDFDTVDYVVQSQAPSAAAWAVALSIAVSVVWLYTEILRLFSVLKED